ncbi:hypothetical protein [Natrialba swarupiae]|uniref:Uncharacterized protein n=1 Tax=Natrialba swarupiae TaxID=2448032 RepID=A0A5D5AQN3_9EURY|nr:hypothetical protein [Natrialba swarupiae]TYT63313.1 hypothetical protein FYC77_04385 [Natrialba swarupiae]
MNRRKFLAVSGAGLLTAGGVAHAASPSSVRTTTARLSYEQLNDYVPQSLAVCTPSEAGYIGVLEMSPADAIAAFKRRGFSEYYLSYLHAYERDDGIIYERGNLVRLSDDGDWQLHARLFPRDGRTEVRGHWEPSVRNRPRAHVAGDDVDHEKGKTMIRAEFDVIDEPFSGDLSMDDRCG